MQQKQTIRGAALALAALAALAVSSAAPAGGTTTIAIRHQTRGCHSWSMNSGPFKASLSVSVSVSAGTVVRFTNNDVMPHKLIQTAGPKVRLPHPNMIKMASSASVKLTSKGVYRFTTKAGEDYAWAASMKTMGEDNVLRLTVRVK